MLIARSKSKSHYSAYLQLTDEGEQLARSIEKKDIEGYR
jgi:hypothetical protein